MWVLSPFPTDLKPNDVRVFAQLAAQAQIKFANNSTNELCGLENIIYTFNLELWEAVNGF